MCIRDRIPEALKDKRVPGVDRTPAENLAYQVGWTTLLWKWEADEKRGMDVKTPVSYTHLDVYKRQTQDAPSVVPKKGIMIPIKVSIYLTAFALQHYLFFLNPASSRYSG